MKEHVWIPNGRDGRLSAMVHVAEGVEAAPVVVVCHGFTGEKAGPNQLYIRLTNALTARGAHAIRFDFTGSGESDGEFRTDTTVTRWMEDLRQVVRWTREREPFRHAPIVLLGHSLGGYVVLQYDDESAPIAGVIALAPIVEPVANVRDTILGPELWARSLAGHPISNFYGKGFTLDPQFVEDLLAHRSAIGRPSALPLLLVHGTSDAAVPAAGSEALFAGYRGPKELALIEGADHVFRDHADVVRARVERWMERIAPTRGA